MIPMSKLIKTYSELIKLPTFEERFRYLKMEGVVGEPIFGFSRSINQKFYSSPEWKRIRDKVILRDNACDLAFPGRVINKYALIHHINPCTEEDFINRDPSIFDLENLICVTKRTHNAIHYGDESQLLVDNYVERKPFDTCPWR